MIIITCSPDLSSGSARPLPPFDSDSVMEGSEGSEGGLESAVSFSLRSCFAPEPSATASFLRWNFGLSQKLIFKTYDSLIDSEFFVLRGRLGGQTDFVGIDGRIRQMVFSERVDPRESSIVASSTLVKRPLSPASY